MKLSTRDLIFRVLHKEAGVIGGVVGATKGAVKGVHAAGNAISRGMAEAGVNSPLAKGVGYAAPYVAAAYTGKKVWESDPVLRARYKVRELKQRHEYHKQRKAMERGYR